MAQAVQKVVLVVEDQKTKDGSTIAVVSGDVHYHKTAADKVKYLTLINAMREEKDEDKKIEKFTLSKKYKKIVSFQMALDSNKEFKRIIAALTAQAVDMDTK